MELLSSNSTATAPWYLAQCKPGQEHIAAAQITARDLGTVFLPREMRQRRWRGRWQTLIAPLFPGYLFVVPSENRTAWGRICSTRGIRRIVSFGAQGPAQISGEMIARLRAQCTEDSIFQPACSLAPGDRVCLHDGPFADVIAQIEALDTQGRVTLLLTLLGREVRVRVDRQSLRPVAAL